MRVFRGVKKTPKFWGILRSDWKIAFKCKIPFGQKNTRNNGGKKNFRLFHGAEDFFSDAVHFF